MISFLFLHHLLLFRFSSFCFYFFFLVVGLVILNDSDDIGRLFFEIFVWLLFQVLLLSIFVGFFFFLVALLCFAFVVVFASLS